MKNNIKRDYKDTLFRIIFAEHKENALSLYNAINGTSYDNADDVIITTIEDVLYIGVKNDISFLIDDSMNLYEHQSTFNPNMPLRGLEYFSILYSNYIDLVCGGREILYRMSRVKIPAPKYYVFYNGKEDMPETMDLKLSDSYEGDGDIEVIAHLVNINYDIHNELFKRCKPLSDYAALVSKVRRNQHNGLSREESAAKAVAECIEEDILSDILKKEANRVISSILRGLTEEEIERLHKEIGREIGLEEGREEGREEMIAKMKAAGLSEEEIRKILETPID